MNQFQKREEHIKISASNCVKINIETRFLVLEYKFETADRELLWGSAPLRKIRCTSWQWTSVIATKTAAESEEFNMPAVNIA